MVRFGPYEVRPSTRELFRKGIRVKLPPQAFEVLRVLLERKGELVTRQEFHRALWHANTFVDFDQGLNNAIKRIREVLNDSAESPRYIETLPRLGYRFIGEVAPADPDLAQSSWGTNGAPANGVEPPLVQESPDAPGVGATSNNASTIRPSRLRWRLVAPIAVLVAATAGGLSYLSRPVSPLRISAYKQLSHDGQWKMVTATDGSRLYLVFRSPNAIAQIGVSGGETAPLPIRVPGSQLTIMDISPDGSDLLIASTPANSEVDTLWTEHLVGESVRRVGNAEWGSFSPDGQSIVFCSLLSGDVNVVNSDGSGAHRLASPGLVPKWPRWSPDGRVIRFQKDGRLWQMASDGSSLHPLLPGWHVPGYQSSGRWSPDGRYYFFLVSSEEHEGGQIWAVDEHRRWPWQPAAQPFQLTSGPTLWRFPLPGRDGKTIFAAGETRRGELSRFDEKTGSLLPFLGGISAEFVSFSRDGRFVAYVSYPDGILWKAKRDGSNRVQLTSPPLYPVNPNWSPDGSQIAFFDEYIRERPRAYVVSSEGGNGPQPLLPDNSGTEADPNWSSDGKRIVYSQGWPPSDREEIRIIDLMTHRVTTLPGSAGMYSSRWSHDGKYIAALSREGPFLRLFDVAAQRWIVPKNTGRVSFPVFSGDSRTIYFLRYGVDQGIFRVRIPDGEEERVANIKQVHLAGLVGVSLSLDPTDAPLVARDIGNDDVYALALALALER